MPEFIILYRPRGSFLFGKNEYFIHGWSARLKPYLPKAEDMPLDDFATLNEDSITFVRNGMHTFPSKFLKTSWGLQIYVDFSKEKSRDLTQIILNFVKWHDTLSVGLKRLATIVLSLTLTLITAATAIKEQLPNFLHGDHPALISTDQAKEKITKTLKDSFQEISPQSPTSIAYFRYSSDCEARTLIAAHSPILNPEYFDSIRVRSTKENGWNKIVAAHRINQASHIKRSDLLPTDALFLSMQQAGVIDLITVPVNPLLTECPPGYISVGFTRELTDTEKSIVIQSLRKAAVSAHAWGVMVPD